MHKKVIAQTVATMLVTSLVSLDAAVVEPRAQVIEPVSIIEPIPIELTITAIEEEEVPIDVVDEEPPIAAKVMRVTFYTAEDGAITASGQPVREGACAAKRDWIGKTAYVYDADGNLMMELEITDTGSHERITSGNSIDIFVFDIDDGYAWVRRNGDYAYVEIR